MTDQEQKEREAGVSREQVRANLLAWIAALRSGKYEQCEGVLHAEAGGYCCLGVALELRGMKWTTAVKRRWGADDKQYDGFVPAGNKGDNATLSVEEMRYLGLDLDDCAHVATMNDKGSSFAEIADVIEKHFLPRYELSPTA